MSGTTHPPEQIQRRAFNNICTLSRGTEPVGEPIADPTTLSVGDMVWARSRGNWRQVQVLSIGRCNAIGIYTTDGAIAEAERLRAYAEEAMAKIEHLADEAATQAVKNRKWAESMADGTSDYYVRWPEDREREMERYAAKIAEDSRTHDQIAADAKFAKIEEIEERWVRSQRPLDERVTYTKVTIKPGEALR